MNIPMQPPIRYPFYMQRPRMPLANTWSTVPFRLSAHPQYQMRSAYPVTRPITSYALSQPKKSLIKSMGPPSPYTNTRYQHLKKSTHHSNRRALQQSYDDRQHHHNEITYTRPYRSSRTKSISELEPATELPSVALSKAHSWHAMMNHRRANLSVAYAHELHLSPKRQRKQSLHKRRRVPPPRPLSSSSSLSPKRRPSFNYRRKRPIELPECGPIRISTLDEMPVSNPPIQKKTRSISHDRLSMKGSISASSTHRTKTKGTNSVKNRKSYTKDNDDAGTSTDTTQSSISIRSRSSLQQRINGALRNDPLISAAMEELRHYRRSSSQNLSTISPSLDRHRNSQQSISALSSTSTLSSHSQSSFTSVERSEIRQFLKTIKSKETTNLPDTSRQTSASDQSIILNTPSSISIAKQKKSCIAEELDREFNKLRALNPTREISYVIPSKICKQRKTLQKPPSNIPPLPTFDELLRQVQLRPIDQSTRSASPIKETQPTEEIYENPLSPIPVPRCSPIPTPSYSPLPIIEVPIEEIKHEYALPKKKTGERTLLQVSHFQPVRNHNFSKLPEPTYFEKRLSRPLSMFNWLHPTPPTPTFATFQPNRTFPVQHEHPPTVVKENIYTSDIDVYVPISTVDRMDNNSLQMHLDNQTIRTDDFYTDFDMKAPAHSSSILNDFSHIFTRKHKHQHAISKKQQRCSIM
ncbi:unnamed protein product [Adineta ricciae]|uniref:Uncharacterized protein n=1 Tax=Adineta ricciae TaxID=249248 RepID=A0A814LSL2_ADIRI|nr:unnamed protein product [Adineta ricciae]CAF1069498.1 unnamed protein product [Adineta ricciae]